MHKFLHIVFPIKQTIVKKTQVETSSPNVEISKKVLDTNINAHSEPILIEQK